MNNPAIIEGGSFSDERGTLNFVNDFDLSPIKRIYTTTNANTKLVRAWMAHRIESRWFFCTEGSFVVNVVKVADWELERPEAETSNFIITAQRPQVLFIPLGYASGFRAKEENSKLLIMSDYALNEVDDNYKFDQENFKIWEE